MKSLLRWLTFNLWYFRNPPWDTQITPPELVEFARVTPPGAALDLGCGTGTNLAHLARLGWQVTGVDFAIKAVESARRRLSRAGLTGTVLNGDVTRLDGVPGPFDLVLDIGCMHSVDPSGRQRYRASLQRLLKPGGVFFVYAHLKAQPEDQIGLDETEIDQFSTQLHLSWRKDSLDRRGRKAVWMQFTR